MNCRAANRLYVRADGRVPCNCDVGETLTLAAPDPRAPGAFHYVDDAYNGAPFVELRAALRAGRMPFERCARCYFFAPGEPFAHWGADGRLGEVADVQVETSFRCALDCEACVPRASRRDPARSALGAGPYDLPDDVFHRLVDDLAERRIRVGEFNFCGRGEPLLHPRFGALVAYARRRHPRALYTACTGAALRFFPGVLELDYLTVSIDGARQESYAAYRRGGRLEVALEFVRQVLRHRRRPWIRSGSRHPELRRHLRRRGRPIVRWKYILFDHNDSDEELVAAQELAGTLGVDRMMFTLSHTWNRSKRFTSAEQLERLPLFQVFRGRPVVFDNLNAESQNDLPWAAGSPTRSCGAGDSAAGP